MTSTDFRNALARLRWTQRGFAALLGVANNTVHRWALGQSRVPEPLAAWLTGWVVYLDDHPPPTGEHR